MTVRNWFWPMTAGVYAALVAAASLAPSAGHGAHWHDPLDSPTQNALHAPAYAALVVLVGIAAGKKRRLGLKRLAVIGLACVAYGIALEWGQALVPGRAASVSDAMHNLLGVAVGLAATALLDVRSRRRAHLAGAGKPTPAGKSTE